MQIPILSFGFINALPPDANLLIDVRFLPNPYYIPELKDLDGRDPQVQQFVLNTPEAMGFLEKYFSLIEYLIPFYENEGRPELTLAVGCTGGKHRSVVIAEEIRTYLKGLGRSATLSHRDMEID